LQQLGDYQILREVGRGGMGVVYEAQQLSLGRHVAIKVLPSHALLDPRHLGRFQREARSAAKLHHTNIVPVFGVGEQDGLHYYVMQFITGLGRLKPNDPEARRDLGMTLNNFGVMLAWEGRLQDALVLYLRAGEHARAAFQQAPKVPIYGRFLAISRRNVCPGARLPGRQSGGSTVVPQGHRCLAAPGNRKPGGTGLSEQPGHGLPQPEPGPA
jgi:hypothetical protein